MRKNHVTSGCVLVFRKGLEVVISKKTAKKCSASKIIIIRGQLHPSLLSSSVAVLYGPQYVENIFSRALKKALTRETDTIKSWAILAKLQFSDPKIDQNANFAKLISTKWVFCKFYHLNINAFQSCPASFELVFRGKGYLPHILCLHSTKLFLVTLHTLWRS